MQGDSPPLTVRGLMQDDSPPLTWALSEPEMDEGVNDSRILTLVMGSVKPNEIAKKRVAEHVQQCRIFK